MQSCVKFVSVFLVSFLLAGCMHTWNGRDELSPDNKYKICVEVHGKSAHAYVDNTIKKADIWMLDMSDPSRSVVFNTWAVLHGGNVRWEYSWPDPSSVRIDFFGLKGDSDSVAEPGFLLLKKEEGAKQFQTAECSENIKIKTK